MNISQAKELDMVDYLSRLGHEPQNKSGNNYWYLSPLPDRNEKTPSFKINRKMNRWYDFADGRGGNLVDFGTLYFNCSVEDFLEKLKGPAQTFVRHQKVKQNYRDTDDDKNRINILAVKPITSLPLISYFRSRRIPDTIAHQYLLEVTYSLKDKQYYALGFKNDGGGYELRNQYIKAASMPKGPSFFDNGAKDLAVFEGSFNFLSYRTMYNKQEEPHRNFLILNSTSFFEKNLPRMMQHENVHLYLDNDKTGEKYTLQALSVDKEKFKDERPLYQQYDDLNDWLVHIGLSQKQRHFLKP